jgi:hypothetical protein
VQRAALDVESGNAQVALIDGDDVLRHVIRFPDASWRGLMTLKSPTGADEFYVKDVDVSCTSLDQDDTTVAVIDLQGRIWTTIRRGRTGVWTPWQSVPAPAAGLTAVKVRVVVLGPDNAGAMLAQFADSDPETPHRLYSSVRNIKRDSSGQTWTAFRPVPYPADGVMGTVDDFAPCLARDTDTPPLSTVNYVLLS